MESLFKIDLDREKEYIPLVNDLVRMSVIHIVTQLLFNISNGESFMKPEFIQTVLFVLLGICVYWLIIRKIVILE